MFVSSLRHNCRDMFANNNNHKFKVYLCILPNIILEIISSIAREVTYSIISTYTYMLPTYIK